MTGIMGVITYDRTVGEPEQGAAGHRQRPRVDEAEHALACEHEAGARKTERMRDGSDHNRQPE